MNTLQLFFKEYFMVRRWFFHHILIGLLVWLVVWAAVMWLATDKYFDDEAEASITIGEGGTDTGYPFVEVQTTELQKTTTSKAVPTRSR